ncbi:acylpyruvate hydrolase [Alteribacillus persepolensis]|uniref:Acylpyruvate hydrolase n=1 Tax=Alteribacillus persepolensis TaxID=568899 RepID=A0A1G8A6W3_9BACI|nr:fumarylacetoacetate hydrolase family protein [Alteribacillus persepolensis]SDH16597.1 acylpyruvate hydrolase [Alteribacillus persepolensis]
MKLVMFQLKSEEKENQRIGVVENDVVVDLQKAYAALLKDGGSVRAEEMAKTVFPSETAEFLKGGEKSLEEAKYVLSSVENASDEWKKQCTFPRDEVKLNAPVQAPQKILCVGHNYREHILEMGRDLPEYPVSFAKFANTIIGPEDDIPKYDISDQLDYEAEFAIVIGKRACNVKKEDALDYVAGYTVANDVTYRDLQRRTLQWLQGKSVDGTAPLGPWLVTSDELTDPSNLEISLSVNGEERQRSNTKNLVFSVEDLVEFFSGLMTLEPGDVILSGTPGGVGFARDPKTFMKDGDVCTVNIDSVGTLENRVKAAKRAEVKL